MPPLTYYYTQGNNERIVDPHNGIWVKHQNVTIEWTRSDQWLNGGRLEFGIRCADDKNGLTVKGWRGENFGNAVFATNSYATFIDCQARKCGGEGFQTGGPRSKVRFYRCGSFDHGWEWQQSGNPRNCAHAFYTEGFGNGYVIDPATKKDQPGVYMEDCWGSGCNGMGLHVRGDFHHYLRCDFKDNRPGNDNTGAGNIQTDDARDIKFTECFSGNGDSGFTIYTDQGSCERVYWVNGAIWQPEDAFATSCYVIPLVVQGGFLCGSLSGIRPRLENDADHFQEASDEAETALAEWLEKYRNVAPPIIPPVVPPETDDELEQAKALLAEREAQMAKAQATLAEAGELNRQVGTLLSRAWNELAI